MSSNGKYSPNEHGEMILASHKFPVPLLFNMLCKYTHDNEIKGHDYT